MVLKGETKNMYFDAGRINDSSVEIKNEVPLMRLKGFQFLSSITSLNSVSVSFYEFSCPTHGRSVQILSRKRLKGLINASLGMSKEKRGSLKST